MSARAWTGGLTGIAVAVLLSIAVTSLLELSDPAAFLVGGVLGGICTPVGIMWAER